MNKKWFVCAATFEEMQPSGNNKKVTRKYLVEAMSFTEAETRVIEEVAPCVSGEFEVRAVSKETVSEIFESEKEADNWFKARLSFITIDEETGAEKKNRVLVYASANTFQDAVKTIEEGMKGSVMDWEFSSMAETAIVDIFRHNN